MSITPHDLLQLSEQLCSSEESETLLRTAISRAYYAAFHSANNFHGSLDTPGADPSRPTGMHAALIHQLANPLTTDQSMRTKSRAISYMLRTLKIERVVADYDLNCSVTKAGAIAQIDLARNLLAR